MNTKNTRDRKLIFSKNNIGKKYNLGIVLPHRPVYDFLSFLCWYSFAVNHEFLNTILFFIGRPNNSFRTWGNKLGCKIHFLKSFEDLEDIESKYGHEFSYPYFISMYNVFLTSEEVFPNSFESPDLIYRKDNLPFSEKITIESCKSNELIPIVKFNFADEDLIAKSIINTNTARKPFLVEKTVVEESANEKKLDVLYRRSRDLYKMIMEDHKNEQQV